MLYHIGREECIIKIEELADKILEYQLDYNWYDMNDNYGNMNYPENKKVALEEIINTLSTDPSVITDDLEFTIENLEFDKGYEKNEQWKYTKELLQQIEDFKEQQAEEDLEI